MKKDLFYLFTGIILTLMGCQNLNQIYIPDLVAIELVDYIQGVHEEHYFVRLLSILTFQ